MRRHVLDELADRVRAVRLFVRIVADVLDLPAAQPGAAVNFEHHQRILQLGVADPDD